MTNQIRIALVMSCVACFATGCDGVEDADASPKQAQAAIEFDFVWPSPDAGGQASEAQPPALTLAAPMTEQQARSLGSVTATEDLMFDWVQWALGQPWADGPVLDTTGEDCGKGQDGPIWYLAGTTGGSVVRECDIPAGKQLVFPLLNTWCILPPQYYPTEESIAAALPGLAAWYDDVYANTCALTLRIDGEDVFADLETMKAELFVEAVEPVDIEVNEENMWAPYGYDFGGTIPTGGAGFYARIHPLTPGDHVVELGGTRCGQSPFSTTATYYLHVGG